MQELVSHPVKPNMWIKAETDRPDAIYKVGEKVIFRVILDPTAPPAVSEVEWTLTLDGATVFGQGTISFLSGMATVEGALQRPGVLRLTVTAGDGSARLGLGMAGAAFDPYGVEATAKAPPDFEDFWSNQRDELAKIPIDPRLEPIQQNNTNIEVFDVSLASVDGVRTHGYIARPKGGAALPAIITLPGMGIRSASLEDVVKMAARGFVALDLTNHDLPNGQPPEFYKKVGKDGLLCYPLQGRDDRRSYYYRRVILGVIRGVDYLVSRPDWNQQALIISGFSEGGGLSLIVAGLDSRITAVVADVPTFCEQSGVAYGRPAASPWLVRVDRDGRPDANLLEVSGYYDACNFARSIKVPVVMNIGLIDTASPPMTCLSAFNLIRGLKAAHLGPLRGHGGSPLFYEARDKFLKDQAGAPSSERKATPLR